MAAPPASDLVIAHLLRDEGFRAPESQDAARAVLEAAGLTRPKKQRIAAEKLERARDAIGLAIARSCGSPECEAALADDGRTVVRVEKPACVVCSGSNNRRGVRRMVQACRAAGVDRVLVVGGRPPLWAELEREAPTLTFRFVDGTSNLPNQNDAFQHCAWADLLVIWAPSPLPHKVSGLYRPEMCAVAHRVTVHRRGVEALALTVVQHFEPS
ncbi:MAG: hypothetical protein OEW24_03835 [Chloroflexota bacterium]|nr:hypothetical protein [Chloroflexota bacterium]